MILFFLVLESSYTCYPGAGESGTSIATLEVCGKKECEKKCNAELLCKGFDFLRTNAKCSCRLFPENTPRKIDDTSNPRQYCEKKKELEKGKAVVYSQISIEKTFVNSIIHPKYHGSFFCFRQLTKMLWTKPMRGK